MQSFVSEGGGNGDHGAEQSTPSHISPTCIRTSFSEDPDGTSRAMHISSSK